MTAAAAVAIILYNDIVIIIYTIYIQ